MKPTKANTRKAISYETTNGTKVSSFETKKGEKFLVVADPNTHENAANFLLQLSDESLAAIHTCLTFLEPNLGSLNNKFKAYKEESPKTKPKKKK
jgi:hypothetical protein